MINMTNFVFSSHHSCSPYRWQDCGWLPVWSPLTTLAGVYQYRLPLLWRLPHQWPVDHLCCPLLAKVCIICAIIYVQKFLYELYVSESSDHSVLCPYFSPWSLMAILGDNHIWENEGTEQYMSVDAIYWHESYDYKTLDYDIMLMKMAHPVTVNQYVKPTALPKACPAAGDMCTVSGWGNIYSDEGEVLLILNVIKTKQWSCCFFMFCFSIGLNTFSRNPE